VIDPAPTPSLAPIVVMSVGDSLTEGTDPLTKGTTYASYRAEMTRLMGMTGQAHTWVVQGVGGTTCAYWAARLDALIVQYHPRLILINCGTNDVPGVNNTEADYRLMLGIAQSRGVPIVASLIGIPDMRSPTNTVRPYIIDWMHATNLAIMRALAAFPSVPYADVQLIPANPEWLTPDGIHWTARAEAAVGQLFYLAALVVMHWLTFTQMHITQMCGLSGRWFASPADPWPVPGVDYRMCGP
jgi:Lysophospholipase L1 and related esterases